ncbi:MAG: hypothetical protein WKF66_00580 [Pedobacter sp.]
MEKPHLLVETTMDDQNLNPKAAKDSADIQSPSNGNVNKTGLDDWNDRLDNNLESEGAADVQADQNAEDFQQSADNEAKPA